MDDASRDVAEDTTLRLLVRIAAIITIVILLACLVTQMLGITPSLALVLLVAQAALLAYGVFEWVRTPRT
jgi:hypothetical protein